MPSRKSDASRRSGVSAARFVLAEDTGMTPEQDTRLTTPEADTRSDTRLAPMTPDEDIAMTPEDPAVSAAGPSATPSAAARPQSEPATAAANTSVIEPHQANQSFSGTAPRSVAGTATSPSEKRDSHKDKDRDVVTIEDLTLPKSIITRLAKGVLPPNTQIQANAILALSKSATVFISHLASTANEFTVSSNKKTIMPADVFKALEDTEFGFMKERLEAEFAKFNEVQTSKRSTYRKKVAAAKKGAPGADVSTNNLGESSMMSMGDDHDEGGHTETDTSFLQRGTASNTTPGGGQPRAAKKAKIDGGAPGSATMDLDGGNDEVSDAETVPDEPEEEEEEEDDEVEEEEEDEEEENQNEDRGDETEDQAGAPDEDEALDDGDDSE